MENSKCAHAEALPNSRMVVKFINDNKLQKEDILSIMPVGTQFVLIYFT